jgi:hypothetical protein
MLNRRDMRRTLSKTPQAFKAIDVAFATFAIRNPKFKIQNFSSGPRSPVVCISKSEIRNSKSSAISCNSSAEELRGMVKWHRSV